MRRAFPRMAAVLAFFIVAGSVPARASSEPPSSRGFSPDQVYHVNGIDSVNDFTGNLDVTIPIGPTYKTNGTLTYAFTLHYHSNLWDYEEYEGQDGRPLGGKPSNWDRHPPSTPFPSSTSTPASGGSSPSAAIPSAIPTARPSPTNSSPTAAPSTPWSTRPSTRR